MHTIRSLPYGGESPLTETPLERHPLDRKPPDRDPPGQRPSRQRPLDRHPLDRDPLDRDLPGQRPPLQDRDQDPPTVDKHLWKHHLRKRRLRAVKIGLAPPPTRSPGSALQGVAYSENLDSRNKVAIHWIKLRSIRMCVTL